MDTESENPQTSLWGIWDRTRRMWAMAVLITACIFGLAWLGSTLIGGYGGYGGYSKFGSRLPDGHAALESMDARLKAAERKWNAGLEERTLVVDRMSHIEKSASSNVRRARTEAGALIEGVKREMSRSNEGIQSKLTGIESTQLEMHAEVVRLRQELAAMRQELDALRQVNVTAPIP